MRATWIELHGDRLFGDDRAISTGFARMGPYRVLLVGHRKGQETKEKLACNFGCAHPEGYRKALAKMKLAERFGLPDRDAHQHPGRLPRHRRRGARAGLGHRREHPRDVAPCASRSSAW